MDDVLEARVGKKLKGKAQRLARANGISQSAVVRDLLKTEKYPLSKRHYMKPVQSQTNKIIKSSSHIVDKLERVRLQLIRIGTNVNQISKHVNSSHNPDTSADVKSMQLKLIFGDLELIKEEMLNWKPK